MKEYKKGKLNLPGKSLKKVKSRKQAIAIASLNAEAGIKNLKRSSWMAEEKQKG